MTPRVLASRPRAVRSDIEGLRAVAVLLVLFFHLRVPGTAGGFAGVDVFFVISGFLITGLLLRELRDTGRINLATFYARRARRLLPAALLVILLTFAAGWWVLPGSDHNRLGQDSLAATLYVVNWLFAARSVDYLAEDAATSPLQHYWSLSVEEQFYLLWPVLILLALALAGRQGSPRSRLTILTALLLICGLSSITWSVIATASMPEQAFFATTTRLWELATGALLAIAKPVLEQLPSTLREFMAAAGLAAILVTVLAFDGATAWPGIAALVPVLGAAAVIAAGCNEAPTFGGRLLCSASLVWLGGLSYALYLWHWPLLVLTEVQFGPIDMVSRLGLGVLAVMLAWVTKHTVEDPIRFHPWLGRGSRRSLTSAGIAMMASCAAVLMTLASRPALEESLASALPTVATQSTQGPTPSDQGSVTVSSGPGTLVADVSSTPWELRPDPSAAYTTSGSISPDPAHAPEDVPRYYDDGCQVAKGDPQPRHDCVYGAQNGNTDVVLLGDSKAGQWLSAIDAIASKEGWQLHVYLKSACPFTSQGAEEPECNQFGRSVSEHLLTRQDVPAVALVSSGSARTPELAEGMVAVLQPLVERGTRVVVLADNPYPPGSRYPCAAENPNDLLLCSFDPAPRRDAVISEVANSLGLPVVSLNQWICPPGNKCPVAVGERLIWRQGSHLTDTYVRNLTPFLYRQLSDFGLTERTAAEISIEDVPPRAGGK